MKKPIVYLFLLVSGAWGQSTQSAKLTNFTSGNSSHTGSTGYVDSNGNPACGDAATLQTTNVNWGVQCGGPSFAWPFQGLTFSGGFMNASNSNPAGVQPYQNITQLYDPSVATWLPSGTIGIQIPFNNFYLGNTSPPEYPIQVAGVNTCNNTGSDCGSTGNWASNPAYWQATATMSGSTFNSTGIGSFVQNGDTMQLVNCLENGTMDGTLFQIGSVATDSVALSASCNPSTGDCTGAGFSGTACGTEAELLDNSRISLTLSIYPPGTTFTGPSGQARLISTAHDILYSNYPHGDSDLVKNQLSSGTWNSNYNDLSWSMKCDYDYQINTQGNGTLGGYGWNLGTYVTGTPTGGLQGNHYYHYFAGNQYANHTMFFVANRTVDHNNKSFPAEGSFTDASNWSHMDANTQTRGHYFDMLQEFYIDDQPNVAPGMPSNFPNGGTCKVSDLQFDLVGNEVDSHVHGLMVSYTGTQYEVSWYEPVYTNNGETFDIRYSTSGSCHSQGWSNCTSAGSVTGAAGSGYGDILWTSSTMSEQNSIWWAIRPHMVVMAMSGAGQSPVAVTTYQGHDLQTGDQVTTDVNQNGITPGTYTITRQDPIEFSAANGHLTHVTCNGTGSCTATVNSTTNVVPGMVLYMPDMAFQDINFNASSNIPVVTSVTSTTITFTNNASAYDYDVSSTGTNNTDSITTFPVMYFDGTTGCGAAGLYPNAGSVTPTSDTSGFSEIKLVKD